MHSNRRQLGFTAVVVALVALVYVQEVVAVEQEDSREQRGELVETVHVVGWKVGRKEEEK